MVWKVHPAGDRWPMWQPEARTSARKVQEASAKEDAAARRAARNSSKLQGESLSLKERIAHWTHQALGHNPSTVAQITRQVCLRDCDQVVGVGS